VFDVRDPSRRIFVAALFFTVFFPLTCSAVGKIPAPNFCNQFTNQEIPYIEEIYWLIVLVASVMAAGLLAFMGIKWLSSDNAQGRADAKKGVIYVLVGLLILLLAGRLVEGIYCAIISEMLSLR